MNLNQITIPSLDIEKAIVFYKTLGLHLIVYTPKRYARFECPNGDTTFSIHEVPELPKGDGIYIYFEVENVDDCVKKLEQEGIQINQQPEDMPWLWREARLKDLDQNQIIIYHAGSNRKNPPWRIRDVE